MKIRLIPLLLSLSMLLCGCASAPPEDPEQWKLKDFEDCFSEKFNTTTETYKLLEGTEEENTVHVLTGTEDGPVIYVVAGVHGDEQAGWRAGNLLKRSPSKISWMFPI